MRAGAGHQEEVEGTSLRLKNFLDMLHYIAGAFPPVLPELFESQILPFSHTHTNTHTHIHTRRLEKLRNVFMSNSHCCGQLKLK